MTNAQKTLLWGAYLSIATACAVVVILAPQLGLGEKYDFILYRLMGLERSIALALIILLTFSLLLFEILAIGVKPLPGEGRVISVLRSAWSDGCSIANDLTSGSPTFGAHHDLRVAVPIGIALFLTFLALLSKNLIWYELGWDQHWWQAHLDYGIEWRTRLLSFGGNALYSFGIQLPFKGQLLPISAIAHFAPIHLRLAVAISIYFVAIGALFWIVGGLIKLSVVHRTIFAGLVALLVTIPRGLDHFIPILPTRFFTSNYTLGLWWGETSLLFLITVFVYLALGTREDWRINLLLGTAFSFGAFAVILIYPVGAVYFVPLVTLYCLGFLVTSASKREWFWKLGAGVMVAALMLAAGVPEYLANLYSYTFGSYFTEFSGGPLSWKSNFLFAGHLNDPRGLLAWLIALSAVTVCALKGKGFLRRIAIAVLVCEIAVITVTTLNVWVWEVPLVGAYAQLEHAPVWVGFLVLTILVLAGCVDKRIATWAGVSRLKCVHALGRPSHRRMFYGALFGLLLCVELIIPTSDLGNIDYPPKAPDSVALVTEELALSPGSKFRGRLMTLVPAGLQGPSDLSSFLGVVEDQYRAHLGNDHFIDTLPFNIPTVNEYGHWTSPFTFAFYRAMFGKEGEEFGRAWFVLSRFDLRLARLVGVRMVVTDAKSLPGGTLIYKTSGGNSELNVFRIDGTNIGQYSPTQVSRIRTAGEAIAALRSPSFDPERQVLVETEIEENLLPAGSVVVSAGYGPTLNVRANSNGRSLLVLPFEYSHCLQVISKQGHASIVPVNLQQTGLIFNGSIEAEITYRFGLFDDPDCRGRDRKRADTLGLADGLVEAKLMTFRRKRLKLFR